MLPLCERFLVDRVDAKGLCAHRYYIAELLHFPGYRWYSHSAARPLYFCFAPLRAHNCAHVQIPLATIRSYRSPPRFPLSQEPPFLAKCDVALTEE
jgi:hypothetical protein